MTRLEALLADLPPDLQAEVEDFAQFIKDKHRPKITREPLFDWAGALKDVDPEASSVDVQHRIADMRKNGL